MYATRLKAVLVVIGLGALVLLVSLFRLQVLEGSRYRDEADERLKRPPGFHPTLRGTIYDRNGVPLAQDTGASDVAIYFPFLKMSDDFCARMARRWGVSKAEARLRVKRMWTELARLTEVPPDELARRAETIRRRVEVIRRTVAERHGRRILVREENFDIRKPVNEQGSSSIPHPLVHLVDLKTVGRIGTRPEAFPGLIVVETRKREYPHGGVAPHVVGRLGEVTSEELGNPEDINEPYLPGHLKRYWPGDSVGRSGAEAAREELLRGARGIYQKGIDGNFLEDVPPVPGRDIHLTIDIALQADVEALLDEPPSVPPSTRVCGAAVVLDCRTGEVLALASAPRYDVRFFNTDYPDLVRDPAGPLLHRAIAGQYPLGSVLKAVTTVAALHEGVLTPQTVLECDGVLDRDHPNRFRCHVFLSHGYGHGALDLREAVKRSCNVYFYQVGMRLGTQGGTGRTDFDLARRRLIKWAGRFGLGRPTGIGLPGEAAGRIDVRDVRNLAVGQGELLVTPIQAAQIYGLVASGGRMPPLRLVRELAPPPEARRIGLNLDPELMAFVRSAFAAVVNEPGGTGYGRANLPDVRVAGKTGTAEAGSGEDHAWFVGFAPAENPRIAFSVIVEHGGHGGEVAGPIAREIVRACKAHGYLDEEPARTVTENPTEQPTPAASVRPVG